MIVDRYEPMNLFALVPALGMRFEPALRVLDQLLDDDALFQQVKADLARRAPQSLTRGRKGTPVEVLLRLLVVKRLSSWSDEAVEYFVGDSLVLRQFCRLYAQRVPDDTVLIRWANLSTPATLTTWPDHVVALAQTLKVTRGRQLRVATTVVETSIQHPSDSGLLGDGVRVLSRRRRRAKSLLGTRGALSREAFRTRTRSGRRIAQPLHRVARRQGAAAVDEMKAAAQRLVGITPQTCAQAEPVKTVLARQTGASAPRLVQRLTQFLPRVAQAIPQTVRRVIDGEVVPAKAKSLSLFEPHTQLIVRHQAGKAVELGRQLWLDEVDGGISRRAVVWSEVGPDHPQLGASLAPHQQRCGHPPWLLAGDRGMASPETEALAKRAGVRRVVIPTTGKASPERHQAERTRWCRRGFRFRAGIEGRIHVLRRDFGLDRCRDHGDAGMARWVGWGVLSANLATIARAVAARCTP